MQPSVFLTGTRRLTGQKQGTVTLPQHKPLPKSAENSSAGICTCDLVGDLHFVFQFFFCIIVSNSSVSVCECKVSYQGMIKSSFAL
jgi:hypothetical protein